MRGFDDVAVDRERVALVRVRRGSRKYQGSVDRVACHNGIDLSQSGDHQELDAFNAFDVWNIVALTGRNDPTTGRKFVVEPVEYDPVFAIVFVNLDRTRDWFVNERELFALPEDKGRSQCLGDVVLRICLPPLISEGETSSFAAYSVSSSLY